MYFRCMKTLFILIFMGFALQSAAQRIPEWKIGDLEHYMKTDTSEVSVINMWATFCKPCLEEIPGFIRVQQKMSDKVTLMLVSLDMKQMYPKKLEKFVQQRGYAVPVVWLNETNADYFCPKIDASWSGSIPATLIINNKSGYRKFFETEMNELELEKEILQALGK